MQAWYFDPIIFSIGPLQVRWYGLMYVIGFIISGVLLRVLVKEKIFKILPEQVDTLITYMLFNMFLGSRLAYVFIYNWDYYSQHLGDIFSVWKGGLSFHGAMAGLAFGALLFSRRYKRPFLEVGDCCILAGTQGVFFGRLGNFINGELYGRVTTSPFGIIFPGGGPYPRHPSQLYEAVFEGLILFLVLWFARKKFSQYGIITALFFIIYGIFRYFIEFFREADPQLGYYFGGTTTMGQILCLLMIFVGMGIFLYSKKNQERLVINP